MGPHASESTGKEGVTALTAVADADYQGETGLLAHKEERVWKTGDPRGFSCCRVCKGETMTTTLAGLLMPQTLQKEALGHPPVKEPRQLNCFLIAKGMREWVVKEDVYKYQLRPHDLFQEQGL